ncbi:MAG: hypothetical protein K2F94_07620 [Muribaculaceae bacterium]|nr:hypothetical protein [Muribaculaceae bacterium]MDE6534198.1 hypothetical protein [Muribaculaceae bacterium]MDE6771310.1 hypothetical protein [Muribaculaceae bacterium]
MNEIKTTFGILPGINSNLERVDGTLSMTAFDDVKVFHIEIDTDVMLILEFGKYEIDGNIYNARCGDIKYDYFFRIPENILAMATS